MHCMKMGLFVTELQGIEINHSVQHVSIACTEIL